MIQQNDTTCAACGGPIVHAVGLDKEFCSLECFRAGRAFCKFCGGPLPNGNIQKAGQKRKFCQDLCRDRYARHGGPISSAWLEERDRSTFKICGAPRTQAKNIIRRYCSDCTAHGRDQRYRKYGREVMQEWGSFAPETRKSLREIQTHMGIGAAKRMATAISREYYSRSMANPETTFIVCHCKTCGKEFKRLPHSAG